MGCARVRIVKRAGIGGNVEQARLVRGYGAPQARQALGWTPERFAAIEANEVSPTASELRQIVMLLRFPIRFYTDQDRQEGQIIEGWMRGEGIEMCSRCTYVAEYLCDYPLGSGKTCDLKLCEDCASLVSQDLFGEDIHYCPQHAVTQGQLPLVADTGGPTDEHQRGR